MRGVWRYEPQVTGMTSPLGTIRCAAVQDRMRGLVFAIAASALGAGPALAYQTATLSGTRPAWPYSASRWPSAPAITSPGCSATMRPWTSSSVL